MYGFGIFIVLILFGLARMWRRLANENRNLIPPSAPRPNESIDGYYRRMDGSESLDGIIEKEGYGGRD